MSLVDWPVYPLAHTTRASIDAQCGLSGPPDQLVDLARKNRRLAGDSKLVDDGGFTPLGNHTAARVGPRLLCGWFCGVPRGPPQLTKETQMLRKFIIGLMKALLDVVILVSLIGGVIVIGVTAANAGGYAPPLVIAEAIIGACALVAVFGVISLLIEINENLICLRGDAVSVRRAPIEAQVNWPQQPPIRI